MTTDSSSITDSNFETLSLSTTSSDSSENSTSKLSPSPIIIQTNEVTEKNATRVWFARKLAAKDMNDERRKGKRVGNDDGRPVRAMEKVKGWFAKRK